MHKQHLILYTASDEKLRTVIKNQHGRLIYLELRQHGDIYDITDCYYVDRIRSGEYYSTPKKLTTRSCTFEELILIMAAELDRKYYGIDIRCQYQSLSAGEFISIMLDNYRRGYKFLIFVGEGDTINGIPCVLKTIFKNRIHRSIYLEIRYNKAGTGIISDCHYCDRKYISERIVVPETLSSVFLKYQREDILSIVNSQLNIDFTNIIFVTDGTLDITKNIPLCGNI